MVLVGAYSVYPTLCPTPFLSSQDDGLMVLCALCQVWQHAICFGFLEETSVPNTHICIMCSKQHGRPTTDPSLVKLTHPELQVYPKALEMEMLEMINPPSLPGCTVCMCTSLPPTIVRSSVLVLQSALPLPL